MAAVTTAAAGVAAITKNAVENFAEYEQLVGGVETLFGNSADIVQRYAENAYKTAGLSANQYMETVTSFSASLLQSLGGDTAEASRVGDMAITDMADNANKMGTSMEAIQNAYQGFAKQNYTMLDNLKLGYGGTKTEMERLLADAEKLSGVKYDISNLSDVYEAIHVIQGELGITGTTAKEASETISGSLAAAKSSWQNLLTGIADENADFGALVDNFVESVSTAAKNILPRITTAMGGVGKLVEGLAPVIAEAIPQLITDVLPPLMESAVTLVSAVGDAIIQNLPMLMESALQLVLMLANGISQNLPQMIPAIVGIILQLVTVLTAPDMVNQLLNAAVQIILALTQGIINAIPQLLAAAPTIISNFIGAVLALGGQLISLGSEMLNTVGEGIMSAVGRAWEWGRDLISNFIDGIKSKASALGDSVKNIAGTVKSFLGFSEPEKGPLSDFHTYAPDMMKLFADGIRDNAHLITDQIGSSFDFGSQIASATQKPTVTAGNAEPMTIIVQSVLDGRVIGETAYKYNVNRQRARGV